MDEQSKVIYIYLYLFFIVCIKRSVHTYSCSVLEPDNHFSLPPVISAE